MKKKNFDKVELIRAYIGTALLTWFGIWSYSIYGIPFCETLNFIRTLGGIVG